MIRHRPRVQLYLVSMVFAVFWDGGAIVVIESNVSVLEIAQTTTSLEVGCGRFHIDGVERYSKIRDVQGCSA